MKIKEREHARSLRMQGRSMNQIIEETGYSKASVSFWTRDIVLTDAQRSKISKRGRSMESIERRRASRNLNVGRKRLEIVNLAKQDFANLSARELKLIGAMIYWGEGRKSGNWSVSVANSDPVIIRVMMKFFREVCHVPEYKFHAHIHTFEGEDKDRIEKYWSQISEVPRKQFYKTYMKPSKASLQKRKTLPNGTVDIYVHDTKLFLTIKGWIEKVADILLKNE